LTVRNGTEAFPGLFKQVSMPAGRNFHESVDFRLLLVKLGPTITVIVFVLHAKRPRLLPPGRVWVESPPPHAAGKAQNADLQARRRR
jgi:hypothetical protein